MPNPRVTGTSSPSSESVALGINQTESGRCK